MKNILTPTYAKVEMARYARHDETAQPRTISRDSFLSQRSLLKIRLLVALDRIKYEFLLYIQFSIVKVKR